MFIVIDTRYCTTNIIDIIIDALSGRVEHVSIGSGEDVYYGVQTIAEDISNVRWVNINSEDDVCSKQQA